MKPLFTITFILLLLTGSVGFPVFAQTSQPSTVVPADRNDKEIELIKEEYKNLKEQNKDMMSRLENERKSHYEFVEKTYSEIQRVFYFSLAILSGLVAFFGWKTQKDLQTQVQEFSTIAAKKLESDFDAVIKKEISKIQVKFDDLQETVKSNTAYKSKGIIIIGDQKQLDSIQESIERLKKKQFQYISPIEESSFATKTFKPKSWDLVIYLFKERDKDLPKDEQKALDKNILEILDILKVLDLPIIIYAPKNSTIPTYIFERHEWILPANSQIAFMNAVFNVSNLLQDRP
ncbi:hypothetical protein APA_1305 [Pseudanabaena sp. lw0831]|uniref:hypothetical protein n=1 Tax=Pseudanabaena sp. lw0831 TaxID=1357935 RepID=UPI0019168620|nr:hypothetical protein [Pseudanabaena sp. lw0831]GBO53398.1 hypothetical protein APA_1305 [Pseudanabaena sp. lw0831]